MEGSKKTKQQLIEENCQLRRYVEHLVLLTKGSISQTDVAHTTMQSIIDASDAYIILITRDGFIEECNQRFFEQFDRNRETILGSVIWDIVPQKFAERGKKHIEQIFDTNSSVHEYFSHNNIHIESSGNPICNDHGQITHVLIIASDITKMQRQVDLNDAQLRLIEYATDHTIAELLQKFLDEAETLTASTIGFFHFLSDDQKTLSLQTWSSNTLENMCTAEGFPTHYPVSQAGVWTDCIREKKPVIHNDYQKLSHKKGLPEGHAPVKRELVVPVFRNKKIVAILGVGNKPTDYTDDDITTIQHMANIAWESIERKRNEEALKQSRANLRTLIESTEDIIVARDREDRAFLYNSAFERIVQSLFGVLAAPGICTTDYLSESDKKHWEGVLRAVLSGQQHREQFKWNVEDTIRYYDSTLNPIYEGYNIIGSAEFTRDITDIKKAEEAIRERELHYRIVADNTYNWETWIAPDGTIRYCSPSSKRITGYSPTEITENPALLESMIHPDDHPEAGCHLKDELDDHSTVFHFDYRLITKDNQIKWVSHYCVPVFDGKGNFIGRRGSTRDITERMRILDELQKNEEKFRHLYDNTPVMLHSIDHEGRLISVSEYWLEHSGYTRDEVIGRKSIEFFSEESQNKAKKLFPQYFRDGYIRDVEYEFVCKNGDVRNVVLSATAEFSENGEFARSLAVMSDITELKEAERTRNRLNKEIQSKARRLEEVNTALKVVLNQREQEKLDAEQRLIKGLNNLVIPYLDKLEREDLNDRQAMFFEILKTNIHEVIRTITNRDSVPLSKLSTVEMQVVDLIKKGKTTKEIAQLLTISESTVYTHRKHIREKLGLLQSHINLGTYLKQ